MYNDGRYRTLEHFLTNSNQLFFWQSLKPLMPAERIDYSRKILLDLISSDCQRDIEVAFGWQILMHAIDDCQLAPIMVKGELKTINIRNACPADPEATAIHETNRKYRADLAREIYALIPAFTERDRNDRTMQMQFGPEKVQVLFSLKQLLWEEATSFWSKTDNDQSSLAMFDWLLGLELSFKTEHEALLKSIREKTKNQKPERIIIAILRIKQFRDNGWYFPEGGKMLRLKCQSEDWLKELSHAWIRAQKPYDVTDQLAIIAPVFPYGQEAWKLLQQEAEIIVAFCRQVQELREAVKSWSKFYSCYGWSKVEVGVRYFGTVEV